MVKRWKELIGTITLWIGIAVTVLVVGIVFLFYVPLITMTESECLKLGYKDGRTTIYGRRYCVSRVQQTDLVVPLEKAREYPLSPFVEKE